VQTTSLHWLLFYYNICNQDINVHGVFPCLPARCASSLLETCPMIWWMLFTWLDAPEYPRILWQSKVHTMFTTSKRCLPYTMTVILGLAEYPWIPRIFWQRGTSDSMYLYVAHSRNVPLDYLINFMLFTEHLRNGNSVTLFNWYASVCYAVHVEAYDVPHYLMSTDTKQTQRLICHTEWQCVDACAYM